MARWWRSRVVLHLNAYDQARFGLLTMHRGVWNGQRILSEEWVRMATTPTPANRGYGFMNWYLNTDQRSHPTAPEYTWTHTGAGSNLIYVDPANELVIVARWIQGAGFRDVVAKVLDAMGETAARN